MITRWLLATLLRFLKLIPYTFLIVWLTYKLAINISDSSGPKGLYLIAPPEQVHVGDLVVLRMPMKTVAARAGQRVRFSPEGVYVDGHLLPNSAPEAGIPRVCPYGTYTVPQGMWLGMGLDNPDSWDGRYLCFLPEELIEGRATPEATWR